MPSVIFPKVGDQPKSPFFKKFPPEVRKMVYTELFGSRIVNILFHSSAYLKPEFSYIREGAPRKIPGWTHCVCQEDIKALPHQHSEQQHEWSYLSVSIIFTCKYAFEEGISILYGSNTLSYNVPSDLWAFKNIAGRYLDLITNLNLSLTSELSRPSLVPIKDNNISHAFRETSWLGNYIAIDLVWQVDLEPIGVLFIKSLRKMVLADGPRFRCFLPNLARKFVEQQLRGDVENNRVEIQWLSDESYSSTRLARFQRLRGLWDEE
ncbi:hypothetical protein NCS52_00633600 [Fusarium sp. LHS14.1]|nr:hypothetical protein NCS52_00633600 [Fusarium sp. LHS14.1]